MAAAETGNMKLAIDWQEAAIRAAKQAGRADLVPELEKNLSSYKAGQPCRRPWSDDVTSTERSPSSARN